MRIGSFYLLDVISLNPMSSRSVGRRRRRRRTIATQEVIIESGSPSRESRPSKRKKHLPSRDCILLVTIWGGIRKNRVVLYPWSIYTPAPPLLCVSQPSWCALSIVTRPANLLIVVNTPPSPCVGVISTWLLTSAGQYIYPTIRSTREYSNNKAQSSERWRQVTCVGGDL